MQNYFREIDIGMDSPIRVEKFLESRIDILLFPNGTLNIVAISVNDKIGGKFGLLSLYLHIFKLRYI